MLDTLMNRTVITAIAAATFALATPFSIAGEIYKTTDENGNTVFTDQPAEKAEPVKVKPINIQESHPAPEPIAASAPEKKEEPGYTGITIVSPDNDTTLRNTGDISISAEVTPTLKADHKVQFTDNGTPIGQLSRNLSVKLTNLDRGSHQFQADIINEQGQVILTSPPVTVHVHRPSLLHKTKK